MPHPQRVLVAGEINPDLVFAGLPSAPRLGHEILARDFSLQLGSSSAIFACGLAKLGVEVAFLGKVGRDFFGRYCLEEMNRAGVDTGAVLIDDTLKTGATVSLSSGDRALVTYPGAIGELRAEDVTTEMLSRCRHLHVASYYLQRALQPGLQRLLRRARELGMTVSFDPGCDPEDRWEGDFAGILQLADLFFLNEVELAGISGSADLEEGLRRMTSGPGLVVAKLGAAGSALLIDGVLHHEPAMRVEAVDTTGAGDSFDAGFLAAWLRGRSVRTCLQCGTICGALSTLGLGGTASQPDWDRVEGVTATMFATEGMR